MWYKIFALDHDGFELSVQEERTLKEAKAHVDLLCTDRELLESGLHRLQIVKDEGGEVVVDRTL